MTVEADKKPWIERAVTIDVPTNEALAALLDPNKVAKLFSEFHIKVESKNGEIGKDTIFKLARVALERGVAMRVDNLETNDDGAARILLEITESILAKGAVIESELRPTKNDPAKSDLEFAVFIPDECNIRKMPFGRQIVSMLIRHELGNLPGRFERIRDRQNKAVE